MIRRSFFIAALIAASTAAEAQPGPPQPAPGQPAPGQPSPEGSQNPYGGPRDGDAGDAMTYLSNDREAAKAVRDARSRAEAGDVRAKPAKAEDVAAGSKVHDKKGVVVGTIESLELDGAVVSTGAARVKVPIEAFGKSKRGLILGISKAEFDVLVAGATVTPAG